jgi:hypothetical protein
MILNIIVEQISKKVHLMSFKELSKEKNVKNSNKVHKNIMGC